ncbi:MAG: polysaccharide biosynthesis/export family protein, partial [Stellaceae bacterium]
MALALLLCPLVAACSSMQYLPTKLSRDPGPGPEYQIGPLDTLSIFVWRHPELSQSVPVRPDGRISIPLIEDMSATGKTSTQLASDLREQLKKFIQDPVVTVIVTSFNGPYDRQVRVIG